MRLTAFEQGTIAIRAKADAEAACLDAPLVEELLALGERMGTRLASWRDPQAIRLHQFVGVARCGDVTLEILPKLDGLSEPAMIRGNLLAMLAETEDLDVRASDLEAFRETSEPFIFALARLYCHRLLEAVRRGLRQDYVLHSEQIPLLRGKVDWAAHAKLQVRQRLEFPCTFDERSFDTTLNRILKAALGVAARLLKDVASISAATELAHAMSEVADVFPTSEALTYVRTDRLNRHIQPLLALASLILRQQAPDQGHASQRRQSTYAFMWDMNVLFEEYVGRTAAKALVASGLKVQLQASALYLAEDVQRKRSAFALRPDIVISRGRSTIAVADTKWKRLDGKAPDFGVSEADVYQLLAYAHRYQVQRGYLVYPHHPALGTPGLRREYEIRGGIQLAIITLDMANLGSIGPTLAQTIGTDDDRLMSA